MTQQQDPGYIAYQTLIHEITKKVVAQANEKIKQPISSDLTVKIEGAWNTSKEQAIAQVKKSADDAIDAKSKAIENKIDDLGEQQKKYNASVGTVQEQYESQKNALKALRDENTKLKAEVKTLKDDIALVKGVMVFIDKIKEAANEENKKQN